MNITRNHSLAVFVLGLAVSSVVAFGEGGALTGAGSTFVNPLMSKWSRSTIRSTPTSRSTINPLARVAGGQQFISKTVAFGASDAPLTDEQITQAGGAANVLHIPVTHGSVVIAYNLPEVTKQLKFSPDTVAGIYLGTIKLWNDPKIMADKGVTLPAKPVLIVHRQEWFRNDGYFHRLSEQGERRMEVESRPGLFRAVARWYRGTGQRRRR